MNICDFQDKVIEGNMASILLSLGSLTQREGNCHVVKILQQPIKQVHLVRKRLSAKMQKKIFTIYQKPCK